MERHKGFPSLSGRIDFWLEGEEIAICAYSNRAGRTALGLSRTVAIDAAVHILELAGCRVRRVAFGHMLPDQVTVGVPGVEAGVPEDPPPVET